MKKESIISTVFLLVVLAVAIVMGLTVISDAFEKFYELEMSPVLFTLIVLLTGFVFNVLFMELAHIFGAKVGKCKVVSVNFYYIGFKKTQNGWKFGFDDFDGLTGETKIVKTEKSKLNAYVWMPIVFYAAELAGCIVLYSMGQTASKESALRWLGIAGLLWIVLSSILFVYDFIPFKLDTVNDGYRLSLLTKPDNAQALLDYMDYQGRLSLEGPSAELKFNEKSSDFIFESNLTVVEQALIKRDYIAAGKMIEKMKNTSGKIDQFLVKRIIAQEMFVLLMTKPLDEVKKHYDENVSDADRKFISNDVTVEALRAYALIAGLIDNSQFEVQYAISKKEKAIKKFLPIFQEEEKELFEEVIKKIQEKHPEWSK